MHHKQKHNSKGLTTEACRELLARAESLFRFGLPPSQISLSSSLNGKVGILYLGGNRHNRYHFFVVEGKDKKLITTIEIWDDKIVKRKRALNYHRKFDGHLVGFYETN